MSDTPRTDAELERVNKMIRIDLEYADMAEVYAWAFSRELERENAELRKQLSDIEEREAACCPEDVSFDTLIAALRKQVLRLERELAEARAEVEKYKVGKVAPADYYSMAEAEEKLCKELAEAQAEVEHWKGECSDLVRMAHEMRAEIDYFQTLIDLQHKRTVEADKLWQVAHNQPDVLPDLGRLIEWLMKRADDMRCCYNCKYGPMCSVDARVCSGCSFAHNNPADGQMRWEAKL